MGGGERPQSHKGGGERERRGGQKQGMARGEQRSIRHRVVRGRRGTCAADGVAMGHARKRGKRATGGCEGRWEQRREIHLRDGRRGGRGAVMGQGKNKGGGRETAGDGKGQNPGEWGKTLGATRPPEWTPIPTEWNGRRGAARPPGWRKTPERAAMEWEGGVKLSLDDSTRYGEGGGVDSSQDDSKLNGGRGGS